MENTKYLRNRFCRDFKLPIRIFDDPYFTDRLELLDSQYHCVAAYNRFCEIVKKYPTEQDYLEEYNRAKDSVIDFIKANDGYQRFNADQAVTLLRPSEYVRGIPGKDIYKDTLVGHTFVSIDMRKANFSVLRYYDPGIFDNKETWEDFMAKFTDNRHIIESKYVREVILGNCNPGRHISYEKALMSVLCEKIGMKEYCVFFSNDEIIYDLTTVPDITERNSLINRIKGCCLEYTNQDLKGVIQFRIEKFMLMKIAGTDGYIRVIDNGDGTITNDIKGVNSKLIPFVLRCLNNEPCRETDRYFIDDTGLLARYVELPKVSIIEERYD